MTGWMSQDRPLVLHPQNPYAASKAAGEHFVTAYRRAYGMQVTVVRPSNNWGPRQQPPKFIPVALEAKKTGVPMTVHGLDISRDWLCVYDNVKAIRGLVEERPGVWNVTTGQLTSPTGRPGPYR